MGLITLRKQEYMTLLITGFGAWLTRRFRSSLYSLDIDECSANSHSCDVNAVCSNNVGSYACACKAGFTGDENTCTGEPFKSNVKSLFIFFSKPGTTAKNILYCTLFALPIKFWVRWEKITVKMNAWSKRTDKRCQADR